MKLAEIEREALGLSVNERASLAAKLLDTLPPEGTDVSDEEVERREQELESGDVASISHEEFVRRVQRARGKPRGLDSKTFPHTEGRSSSRQSKAVPLSFPLPGNPRRHPHHSRPSSQAAT